jgi:Phosphatidylinositol transfer protein
VWQRKASKKRPVVRVLRLLKMNHMRTTIQRVSTRRRFTILAGIKLHHQTTSLPLLCELNLTCHVSRLPGWVKAFIPGNALKLEEKAWNAYPYCKTGLWK